MEGTRADHFCADGLCLGMLYSCGHSRTCRADEAWEAWHRKEHRWDWTAEVFFWSSVMVAVFVWAATGR